ncbi:MAG TPA: dihydrodipicolinate synthase family protein [Candidatus Binatia bacterium]|nr:dihydrodipicolinate synthase family protein [Candidatus Binatia bacterium]
MTDFNPGPWTANLTPLNADLSIDVEAYLAHVRWLLDAGSAGVAALGTTGEANSFSLTERLGLIAVLAKSGIERERLVIGTGCCAQPDTIALTRAVLDAGYTNVLMLPPFYYKGVSEEGVFRAYAQVIESIGDTRLRVLVYDFPQMTGLKISTALLGRLQSAFRGVVVGVKNSSGDWLAMEAATKELPGFLVFAGSEQFLLPTLRAGGPGCISATANVTIRGLANLMRHWRDPDASARQEGVTRTRLMLQQYPAVPALKEIMAHATGHAEWKRLRAPLINLSPDDAIRLLNQATAAGLVDDLRA